MQVVEIIDCRSLPKKGETSGNARAPRVYADSGRVRAGRPKNQKGLFLAKVVGAPRKNDCLPESPVWGVRQNRQAMRLLAARLAKLIACRRLPEKVRQSLAQ